MRSRALWSRKDRAIGEVVVGGDNVGDGGELEVWLSQRDK